MKLTVRPVLAVAVCAALAAGTGIAAAAPAAACNLLKDAKGDGTALLVLPSGGPSDGAWDILSADLASTKKGLTTVVRVDKLAQTAATSPTGVHWRVDFKVGDVELYTSVVADAVDGLSGNFGYIDPDTGVGSSLGGAAPVLDMAKNEVRITVPDKAFGARATLKKAGTQLTGLAATAGRFYNFGAVTLSEGTDSAATEASYTTGTPSCVKK